jgi:hypothetical protein
MAEQFEKAGAGAPQRALSLTASPNGCHCQASRRHGGMPVSVFVAFERAAYVITKGEITKFASSAGVE